MKSIKDRADSNSISYNNRANEQMIRYRQFDDGEGELKTGLRLLVMMSSGTEVNVRGSSQLWNSLQERFCYGH